MQKNTQVVYGKTSISPGIRSRFLNIPNGLKIHLLEAGFSGRDKPCVLLLHGFPELAYSWRKVMLPLAKAGFHVIAPDQRGYGRTTGWDSDYDGDLRLFRFLNLVKDTLEVVLKLGFHSVATVVGHDFGSPIAAWCSLIRPDIFRSVVLMSSPFGGPPSIVPKIAQKTSKRSSISTNIHKDLAVLKQPRKHYQLYYSTREANSNMRNCPQGIHNFLRAYYHYKSADWKQNKPFPLSSWTAIELAKLPTYYIMDFDKGMAETVAPHMPSPTEIMSCNWLSEEELQVYSSEFNRTGFQGGLQWYRCARDEKISAELEIFTDLKIEVPACFIAGKSDWGVHQKPGIFEVMQTTVCSQMRAVNLIDGAGHWVQQEQPKKVSDLLINFLGQLTP